MITSGKQLESIVEKLSILRREIEVKSSMGLTNINKHCENFLKVLLNLIYGYDLKNLNEGTSNFPDLDLGDTLQGIAYLISATKTSEKIEKTLVGCMKHEHYKTFRIINVFIVTSKQSSYTIKTITAPHFAFDPGKNIIDFNILIKDIANVDPKQMESIYDHVNSQLEYTISTLRGESTKKKSLIDIGGSLQKSGMTSYRHWISEVTLINNKLSVPDINTTLGTIFLNTVSKRNLLPVMNAIYRKKVSSSEMLYYQDLYNDGVANHFGEMALLIEPSSVTFEIAQYSDQVLLTNLLPEMLGMLTLVLFFAQQTDPFEIAVDLTFTANKRVIFHPQDSLTNSNRLMNTYELGNNHFRMEESLSTIKTSELASLLQNIMYAFVAETATVYYPDPYVIIEPGPTEFVLDNIKKYWKPGANPRSAPPQHP